jgi:acyl-homoserine lactone acylase PvdQ
MRSTRGRELLAAIPFQVLSTGGVRSPQDFVKTMSGFDLTFNWLYADSKHIAMYSSGRLPLRTAGVNPGLPTNGNGSYEWRGWLAPLAHPYVIDPPSGAIVNWNNKPAAGFPAADDNWSYGAVHRVDLLDKGVGAKKLHTPASVVGAMNAAATLDLRQTLVPLLARLGTPSTARGQEMLTLLKAWDGSRLDGNGDGKVDAAGAAIMDAWWPKLAVTVLEPQLGSLTDDLQTLAPLSGDPNPQGNAYGGGWYSYVDKDLRTLLGQPVEDKYSTAYCGGGNVGACAAAVWQSLDRAGADLAAAQGPDPAAWRSDATKERIKFSGFIPETMRWANRPTFQQVTVFRSHR